jgi:serine/threonine protein kinase
MPASLDCPEIESCRALFSGTLHPDERERTERHLEACEICQRRLDSAEECGDPLLRLGRQVGDPTLKPADPTLTYVLERLHEVKSGTSVSPGEPADLFFLRPAEKYDVLGMLGAYEVSEVLGQGGMGVVLKAYEPALHRLVAIKVLAPAIAGSATARKRFTREAQAAAAVCHDHVVTVHGVDETDGLPYLVMQYIDGESLQARLDRSGPLEVVEIVRIGLQTAQGLAAAHAQGLIHRDIKPANLLLENGLARVKITDFGLARMTDDVALTQNGVVAGTPEYMAPEQARGEPVDHRSDLFSLGSVLYATCTGVPPFRGPSTVAVLRQVSDITPTSIRELNPEIPAWLEAVVQRLMASEPGERFQNASEVALLLEGYLAHLRQPTRVPAPRLPDSCVDNDGDRPLNARQTILLRLVTAGIGLVSVTILSCLALAFLQAANDKEKETRTRPFQECHLSLKGDISDNPGIELAGPDADSVVKFEPEGLRITLPDGWKGVRQNTGVRFPVHIVGDCEITLRYQVLSEQSGVGTAAQSTRITLGTGLQREGLTVGTLSRRLDAKSGPKFFAWMMFPNETTGKTQYKSKVFPAHSSEGQLRLSRTGDILSYLVSEGSEKEFTLLHQLRFGAADLDHVHVVGSTGSARSSLDVRVTDLHVRAESLPSLSLVDQVAAGSLSTRGRSWLTAGGIIGLVVVASLSTALFFTLRRQRRKLEGVMKKDHSTSAFSFGCPECGATLKARPSLAGKRVKCPQCSKPVSMPQTAIAQPDSTLK